MPAFRSRSMTPETWVVEGFRGTTQFFEVRVPYRSFTEKRMGAALQTLAAKYGLSDDEILDAFTATRSPRHVAHLEITRSHALPFSLSCGHNPFFTARVERHAT